MSLEQLQFAESQSSGLRNIRPVEAHLEHILAEKPAEFATHGYDTQDDIEELIENLMQRKILVAPVCKYRARGSSSAEYPKVELRIVLQLQYPAE